ncbi:MAG: FkbM family methyltransferase [Acidimicrobiales bacterium]
MGISRFTARSAHWVREIWRHPANRGARLAAVGRAAEWHWRTRGGAAVEALVVVDDRTRLVARPGQFSAVWTIYDGIHEWEELQFCFRYLRPGDHFVDVGANVGVFSALIGTRLPGVRITAVEPFPPIRAFLERNLALNDLDVQLVDSAVGAESGSATFEVLERDVLNRLAPASAVVPRAQGITVAVQTLDEIVGGSSPALIKIDVEGTELDVLRGARHLLLTDAPVVLFEHCGHGNSFGITPADVRSFLAEVGYRIYLLDGHLTPWDNDALPPVPNVVAARDIDAVHERLRSPGGAPAVPPVRVRLSYRPVTATSER